MKNEYKKGDKLEFLFNGKQGTQTCYIPGEILTVTDDCNNNNIYVIGSINITHQVVYPCQVKRILNLDTIRLPQKDEYITVYENDVATQIIKVKSITKNIGSTINIAGTHLSIKQNVFYNDAVGNFDFANLHTFKQPSFEEKYWFDWCVAANEYIPFEHVPFIGDYVLIRPDSNTTITGILHKVDCDKAAVINLKVQRGETIVKCLKTFIINNQIKKVTAEFVGLYDSRNAVTSSFRSLSPDSNGGFKIGDYILVEAPGELLKIAIITEFPDNQTGGTIYAYLTYICSQKILQKNWFTCLKGNSVKTSPLNEDQRKWLDYCISLNKYVSYEKLPDSLKKEEEIKTDTQKEFPSSGWCKDADKKIGEYLALKFDCPYVSPGGAGYAWNHNSYWKIDTASGKPNWTKEYLKNIIKQETFEKDVERLSEYDNSAVLVEKVKGTIPLKFKEGDVVRICKTRFEEPGYHRFKLDQIVTIIKTDPSNKLSYRCTLRSDAWWVAEEDLKAHNVNSIKKGDIVKVILGPHPPSHRFNIGEIVECIEIGTAQSRFVSRDRPSSIWWLYPEEYELNSTFFGKVLITGTGGNLDGKNGSNPLLSDETGQMPKYIGGIDSVDGWRSSLHVWVQDPTSKHLCSSSRPDWMHDLHTIDHVSLIESEGEVVKSNVFSRIKNMFPSKVKLDTTLKDRTVKPVEVKPKIKNIDNGLIVPLEPIKNRIIK